MPFRQAVESAPGLEGGYRLGLGALKREHRAKVHCPEPRRLCGSVDLDGNLKKQMPNDPRWDYGICHVGIEGEQTVYWVEVHGANEKDIRQMSLKLGWLKRYLSQARSFERFPQEFVWIAPKKIGFLKNSRQFLRHAGLPYPKTTLVLK